MNTTLKTTEGTGEVHGIELDDMGQAAAGAGGSLVDGINPLHQVKTTLQVSVGNLSMSIGELMALKEQQVVRLGQKIEDAIELLIGGKTVARGQLVAVDGHFAIRITELPVALHI